MNTPHNDKNIITTQNYSDRHIPVRYLDLDTHSSDFRDSNLSRKQKFYG